MKILADAEIDSLQNLSFNRERNWFKGREECLASLLVLLARQTTLKSLEMEFNELSEAQKQQICDVVEQTAANCEIKKLD